MKYTHIAWDFNGTLLDDVSVGVQTMNTLLSKRKLSLLRGQEEYRDIFCFPIIEYYRRLGFDFETESFDILAVEWMAEYLKRAEGAQLFSGVRSVLQKIGSAGAQQIILSASEKNTLIRQLRQLEIDMYFSDILGLGDIYANSKLDIAQTWANKSKDRQVLLIGDTVHDCEVASAVGFDCILIAQGHQSKLVLEKCEIPVLSDISEVFDYIF